MLVAALVGLLLVMVLVFRADPSGAGDGEDLPDPMSAIALRNQRTELVNVPQADRLFGVGARAALAASGSFGDATRRVYVDLRLFAEGQRQLWETEPLDGGAPFSVAAEELEEGIRAIVVPDRLPALARTLQNAGIDVTPGDLEVLPFMLEVSPGLERELVRRRLSPIVDTGSREEPPLRSSEGGPR